MIKVEIPCMVGTKAYIINRWQNRVYEHVVIKVKVGYTTDLKNHLETCYTNHLGGKTIRKYSFRQVGRYVFFTREEAEQALARGVDADAEQNS